MSRPAMAARDRCQTSVFSRSERFRNPSAYTWTMAASSIRSSRYVRSAGEAVVAGAGPDGVITHKLAQVERNLCAIRGDLHRPLLLCRYSCSERLERDRFAMDEIRHRRGADEAREPAHDLARVGVGRHRVDALDACGDGHDATQQLHLFGAVDEIAASRPGRLVADKQHGVVWIG